MKSLRDATTSKALCALERDNFSIGPGRMWGLLGSEKEVYLSQQKIGEAPTQRFSIPRRFFNELIDLYMAEQHAEKAKTAPQANRKANERRVGTASRAQAPRGRGRKQSVRPVQSAP